MYPAMKQRGQSLIEVTIGIVVLCGVMIVLFDLAVLLYGVQSNERVCQNATRAAASGDPKEVQFRAQTAIDLATQHAGSAMVSPPQLVLPIAVKIDTYPQPEFDIAANKQVNPGGPVEGTVTVTTQVTIRPLVIYRLYGAGPNLVFKARRTFPICYVVPGS